MRPATLKTLAQAAGLSVSTISLALRKDGRVKEKTRLRIERLAQKYDYRPNAAGAILAGFKTGKTDRNATIAVVMHTAPEEGELLHPYYKHLQALALTRGYTTEHCNVGKESETRPLIRRLYQKGVTGVILSHIRKPDFNLFEYSWDQFSTVGLLRTRHNCPYDLITGDAFYTTRECWRRARIRGYRRIGVALCRHQPFMEDDFYREGAFAVCQNELTSSECAIPPFLGEHSDENGFLDWHRRHKPDVVIGFTVGHYWLLKSKVKIPKQVGFVSLHTFPDRLQVSGCIRNENLEIAMAVDHIDLLIRHSHRGRPPATREILIRPLWQEGITLE